ncbi:hypothetical protein VD659_15745 [Herbiconiux sp. 11R-BC]|uniref:hypothetical protein n=1 Tax=Herbiconiux sp. 11R-BC TaxID=3111637 RepID=UPI003BFF7774
MTNPPEPGRPRSPRQESPKAAVPPLPPLPGEPPASARPDLPAMPPIPAAPHPGAVGAAEVPAEGNAPDLPATPPGIDPAAPGVPGVAPSTPPTGPDAPSVPVGTNPSDALTAPTGIDPAAPGAPEVPPSTPPTGPDAPSIPVGPNAPDAPTAPTGIDSAAPGAQPKVPGAESTPGPPAPALADQRAATPFGAGHPDDAIPSVPAATAASTPLSSPPAATLGHRGAAPARPRAVDALALAAVVIGGLAFVGAFVPFVNYGSWLLALIGLILGIVALVRRGRGRGLALSGTILSGVALILSVVLALVYTVGFVTSAVQSAGSNLSAAEPGAGQTAPDGAAVDVIPATFGQVVTYDDGMRISVSEPAPFTPSASGVGADQASELAFTVEIYNGTGADYQPLPTSGVTSKGVTGSPIVDPANGMSGMPPVAVIPAGQTVTYVEGYSVADPNDVSYDVAPGFEYTTARFRF